MNEQQTTDITLRAEAAAPLLVSAAWPLRGMDAQRSTALSMYLHSIARYPERVVDISIAWAEAIQKAITGPLDKLQHERALGCLANCIRMGLPPNDGSKRMWIIPRKEGRDRVVYPTAQIGYPGMIELVDQSFPGLGIIAEDVIGTDEFDIDVSSGYVRHVPDTTTERTIDRMTLWYCRLFRGSDNNRETIRFAYIPKSEFSKYYKGQLVTEKTNPWKTNPRPMSRKSVLMFTLRSMPLIPAPIQLALRSEGLSRLALTDGQYEHHEGFGEDYADADRMPPEVSMPAGRSRVGAKPASVPPPPRAVVEAEAETVPTPTPAPEDVDDSTLPTLDEALTDDPVAAPPPLMSAKQRADLLAACRTDESLSLDGSIEVLGRAYEIYKEQIGAPIYGAEWGRMSESVPASAFCTFALLMKQAAKEIRVAKAQAGNMP